MEAAPGQFPWQPPRLGLLLLQLVYPSIQKNMVHASGLCMCGHTDRYNIGTHHTHTHAHTHARTHTHTHTHTHLGCILSGVTCPRGVGAHIKHQSTHLIYGKVQLIHIHTVCQLLGLSNPFSSTPVGVYNWILYHCIIDGHGLNLYG